MHRDDVLARFFALLDEAGVDRDSPTSRDVTTAWEVMRRFASIPVDGAEPAEEDGDGILAQYGPSFDGSFQVDMTRQLTFHDEDGEYNHMRQLHCSFFFPDTEETRAAGSNNHWSFDLDLDALFTEALAVPGFQRTETPTRLKLAYSPV